MLPSGPLMGEEHIPDLAEVVRQAHEELDAKA